MAHLRFPARLGILIAGLVLAIGALAPASALADVGGSNLPFKGTLTGTSTLNLATFEGHAVLTGTATHFGLRTSELFVHVVPSPLSYTGTVVWTAADGDQLFGDVVATGTRTDATHVTWVVVHTSTGGTGRFADASATWTSVAYAHTVLVEGGIQYSEVEGTFDGQFSW